MFAKLLPVLATFSKTALEVCEGQQMDMDFETMDQVPLDMYIMIQFKTSVLLGCAMKIGALVGVIQRRMLRHCMNLYC